MTDYELLKCAAEAMHNLKDQNFCNYSVVDGKAGVCLDLGSRRGAITSYWNPLTDDGDALRLAVKLGMLFTYMTERFEMFQRFYQEELDKDYKPSEATRRAIVRVASEIGKQIKGGQHDVE